ncbi:MAG: hypothetical protein JWP74_3225 [Marmoricola sp.]|nr:hypothetical protein [Marmoricola sp.]
MIGEATVGKRLRRVAEILVTLVVVLAVVTGVLRLVHDRDRTDLSRALDVVPAATLRLSFTDWAQVRRTLHVKDETSPDAKAVASLVGRAYDADLSAVSSIDDSAPAMQKYFGFSPSTITWEAYGQSKAGAAMVAKMPTGFDFSKVRDHLLDVGFKQPSSTDGVWNGGVDLIAATDETLTPEMQYVAVLADQGLIVSSDQESYAKQAVVVAEGKAKTLGDVASTRSLVDKLAEPAAAMIWSRDFACSDLAMSTADPGDQDQAQQLITAAGKTTPLTGLVMAFGGTADKGRAFRVAEGFESGNEARENLRARARLAVGPAVGRGGSFSDDLTLTSSKTNGAAVMLDFTPTARSGYVLSTYDSGPVLFATC